MEAFQGSFVWDLIQVDDPISETASPPDLARQVPLLVQIVIRIVAVCLAEQGCLTNHVGISTAYRLLYLG